MAAMEKFQPTLYVVLKSEPGNQDRPNKRRPPPDRGLLADLRVRDQLLAPGQARRGSAARAGALRGARRPCGTRRTRAREDPVTERAWNDRVKAMMVYLIDYKMLNTDWDGRNYWFVPEPLRDRPGGPRRTSRALGGEKFFEDCDEMQQGVRARRAPRPPGQGRTGRAAEPVLHLPAPGLQGAATTTGRRNWPTTPGGCSRRLPAYATTRGKEMFPEAYRHNQELKVDYKLGMSLTMVLVTLRDRRGVGWSRSATGLEQRRRPGIGRRRASEVERRRPTPAGRPSPAGRRADVGPGRSPASPCRGRNHEKD